MKKMSIGLNTKKDNLLVVLYFLSGIIYLNVLHNSFTTQAVGVAFFLAALYGVVCISKGKKFLFE